MATNAQSSPDTETDVLLGREHEVAEFRAATSRLAQGQPAIMVLCGAVGSGRSRLLAAFDAMAIAADARTLVVACNHHGERPLGALHHARGLSQLPDLNAALAHPHSIGDLYAELISSLTAGAASDAGGSLWLMIDDFHDADEVTHRLVIRLIRAICQGPLRHRSIGLVLVLQDDRESQELHEHLLAVDHDGVAVRLELAGLRTSDIAAWLQDRFGARPEQALVELMTDVTAGNPLLLGELASHLERLGILRRNGGELTARSGARGLEVTSNITELLKTRITAISTECRQAMTVAAFLGQEFQTSTLAALLDRRAGELRDILAEAQKLSLIEQDNAGSASFTHSATRLLLYDEADLQGREQTHLQIGQRLIDEFGAAADDHCLTITHHLLRGGSSAEPEAVLHFASRAAEMALSHHSYFLAGRYFEAAARAGADILSADACAQLFCSAGDAFQRWSDGRRSTACLTEAVTLFRQAGNLPGVAQALQAALRNQIAFGEATDQAAADAQQLETLLDALAQDDAESRVRICDTLAAYHHSQARYDAAEGYAQQAMDVARRSGQADLLCIPVTSLAMAQMEQLRLADARDRWLEGLDYDRAAGQTRHEGFHLQRLPMPLYCLGEVDEAERFSRRSYQHNRAIGNTGELCLNLANDVMIANLRGNFDVAIEAGREAMELMATTRYLWSAPTLVGALACALTMSERFDEAQAVIEHLSRNGLTFDDTGPYRATAERLQGLVEVHRTGAGLPETAPAVGRSKATLRAVRVGSVGRLCAEAELALLGGQPERLDGVHDTLEYVHRRGVVLALGWCCSVTRSLGASAALRGDWTRALGHFDEAAAHARRADAALEIGRVDLYRGLAGLARANAATNPVQRNLQRARSDLQRAGEYLHSFDAPALARLADRALRDEPEKTATHQGK